MKKTIFHFFKSILSISILFLLFSCNSGLTTGSDNDSPSGGNSSESTPQATTAYEKNTSTRNIITDDSKDFTYENTLTIDLSSPQDQTLTDTAGKEISVSYDSATGCITVDSSGSSQNLKVTVTGTTDTAHIYFKNAKKTAMEVQLDNAVINSSGNYPAISFDKAVTVYFELTGTNSITDGRKYGYGYGTDYTDSTSADYTVSTNPSDGEDTKGTIYFKGPVLILGDGSLNLTEGYKHGIYSKDYIRIFSGTINITTTGRNGIQCVNGFIMDDGNITIKGTGEYINNQSRGIIVEGEESTDYPGEGFIVINGGNLDITTVSKAISAKWDIDEDAESTDDTTDDPYPYVKITGGNITIKTTGTPADESTNTYTFTDADGVSTTETTKLSPEGIEGKQSVIIEGGTISLNCTDDCINASRSGSADLTVSGGTIYAYSSNNDSMDSNGTLNFTGGTIVALTSTTPECAFDCDNYTFTITGGTFIGIGTSNYSKPTSSVCTQSTVVLSGDYLGNSTFVIGESLENPVFAYKLDSSIFTNMNSQYVAILSSPALISDTSYTLFTNCTVSGGTDFNGLYTTMPSVTNGTSKASEIKTTSSSKVYTLSSSANNGAQEGTHGNPQDDKRQNPGSPF